VTLSGNLIAAALGLALLGSAALPWRAAAQEPVSTPGLLAEVRKTFTLAGKRIPPEIFRDFGDGWLADNLPIWVTVDLRTAIDSNLYFDEIKQGGDWVVQRKLGPGSTMNAWLEETSYRYIGAIENGLLVVLAVYNEGGSGYFFSLHVLSIEAASAFASGGDVYERLNLTNLRSIPLGDRWGGEVHIENNTVRVVTTRRGPADKSGRREEMTIEARKP
jgi:hypothetical protein